MNGLGCLGLTLALVVFLWWALVKAAPRPAPEDDPAT